MFCRIGHRIIAMFSRQQEILLPILGGSDEQGSGKAGGSGGYSAKNVSALKTLGVKDAGLAPRGRAQWSVNPLLLANARILAPVVAIVLSAFQAYAVCFFQRQFARSLKEHRDHAKVIK
jgi:hypothetical protein